MGYFSMLFWTVILSLKDSDIEDLMLYLDDPEFYNNIKNYNL